MAELYISQKTIEQSYKTLTETNYKYGNEIFHLLIMKRAGITKHGYISFSDDAVKAKIIESAKRLSRLFLDDEVMDNRNQKYNFINPFTMLSWENQPSESLKAWAPLRLVNNVTGGGKLWKRILEDDDNDPNTVKLRHDYLDYFEDMTIKYPLDAISIWFNRFTKFSTETAQSVIINDFLKYFSLSDDEKAYLFSSKNNVTLSFANKPIDSHVIRELIGNPKDKEDWTSSSVNIDTDLLSPLSSSYLSFTTNYHGGRSANDSIPFYKAMLDKANQAIFMGPPGTSKSYAANLLSKEYTHTMRIQFHPQYSYQDFIGGKILEQGTLKDKKGEFILFLEDAIKKQDETYLLVIEEINRANISQVFGELIQLLDREEKLYLSFDDIKTVYYIPENLKIIGTMNTTDRTVGRIDYALKRRFYQVYFDVDYDTLVDSVALEDNSFSVADFLLKINSNLFDALNNKEMVIGHAIFLRSFAIDHTTKKYIWNVNDFADLFYYVVFPIIEDYCNGKTELITSILGETLVGKYGQLRDKEFANAIVDYINKNDYN